MPLLSEQETKIILSHIDKCVCKIIKLKKMGTGFFCKIFYPDQFNLLPALITNHHILMKMILK